MNQHQSAAILAAESATASLAIPLSVGVVADSPFHKPPSSHGARRMNLTQHTEWTPEMDSTIVAGFREGRSAREVAERLGVTRNAVLGRSFRMGLSIERSKLPSHTPKPRPQRISLKTELTADQLKERIQDMRELGCSWTMIGADLGVETCTVRGWAIKLGVFVPKTMRKFSAEDLDYIRTAWMRNDHVEDIAAHLNRSFGSITQVVLRMQRKSEIGSRDPAKTRLLRQYGEAALKAGETPSAALKALADAKTLAFAASMNAAREAKLAHARRAIEEMHANIAGGMSRNAAVFQARASGVHLELLASEFGLTRERIRQLCNMEAQRIALEGLLS